MARPIAENGIILLRSDPKSLAKVESFLRGRNWQISVFDDTRDLMNYLMETPELPKYAMVNLEHPSPQLQTLPSLINVRFGVKVIGYFDKDGPTIQRTAEKIGVHYVLYPPISGPSVERMFNRIKIDELRAEKEMRDQKERNKWSAPKGPPAKKKSFIQIKGDRRNNHPVRKAKPEELQFNFVQPDSGRKKAPLIFFDPGPEPVPHNTHHSPPAPAAEKKHDYRDQGSILDFGEFAPPEAPSGPSSSGLLMPETATSQSSSDVYHAPSTKKKKYGQGTSAPTEPTEKKPQMEAFDAFDELFNDQEDPPPSALDAPKPKTSAAFDNLLSNFEKRKETPPTMETAERGFDPLKDFNQPLKPQTPLKTSEALDKIRASLKKQRSTLPDVAPTKSRHPFELSIEMALHKSLEQFSNTPAAPSLFSLGIYSQFAFLPVSIADYVGYLVCVERGTDVPPTSFLAQLQKNFTESNRSHEMRIDQHMVSYVDVLSVNFSGLEKELSTFYFQKKCDLLEIGLAFLPADRVHLDLSFSEQSSSWNLPLEQIATDEKLDFDLSIFMPINNRSLLYMRNGDIFTELKKERLMKGGIENVSISTNDVETLARYLARAKINRHLKSLINRADDY